ncbi:ABC transporter substrate-binding protein [Gimesia panareensis]|uniref:ABC transporter substrate-binding protein n=1 Tax=Gimesia panareensis TaxID=2527978 RepID=UPI00118BA473|nr:ABC transporter substrate-binding protein [Gimesia panareensis]QDU50855.1 Bacterial extracellular solute-binding protein, family 5 Middle [Gimesia panareensis]
MIPWKKFLILLICLVWLSGPRGLSTCFAQNEKKTDPPNKKQDDKNKTGDSKSEEEDKEPPLPKLEEMQTPSVEDLLKKPPVDWVVLETDQVLIVQPVYPRPDTLGKLEAALKASYDWPKAKSKEEQEEQREKRASFNFINLTLVGEKEDPEYRIQRQNVKQIVYYEDQILKRIDALLTAGDLKTAFEMLLFLDRRHRDWPGFDQRQQRLLFLEAQDKQKANQYVNALAFVEDLQSRVPDYPGLSKLAGEIIDTMISRAVKVEDYREAHHYLNRLATIFPRQATVAKWRDTFLKQSDAILQQANQRAQQNDYQQAFDLVMEASVVWPVNPRLRDALRRYQARYPVINVGVLETALDQSPYFLECNSTRRHEKLTQIPLFEVGKVDQTPLYQSRFFEQWEPTDLGRRADFVLRQSYATWESHPMLLAADIAQDVRARITPGNSAYDERFDSYVHSITTTAPFTFRIHFDRVPLSTEWLLSFPITSPPMFSAVVDDPQAARLSPQKKIGATSRFVIDQQDSDSSKQVSYIRAVPEPEGLRDYNVAQINEVRYPTFEKSFQALLRGEVGVLPFLPAGLVSYFKEQDEFNVVQSAIPLTHVLQFNPESKPLQILELRRALAYAIDRQKILTETLLHESNLLNGRLVTAPFYSGLQVYNQQVPQRDYNFPLAVALAVASQKKLGGQFPTLHLLCDPNPEAQDAAQELIKAWRRIGVIVTLIPNTPEEAKKENLKWDIVYRTTAMTQPTMELWPFLTVGKGAEIKSLEIFPDWMRQKLIELDESTDWETATTLIKKLQRQLYSMAHIIPLWEIDQFHVFRTNIKGYADRPLNFYDNVEQWITTPVYPRGETLTSTQALTK